MLKAEARANWLAAEVDGDLVGGLVGAGETIAGAVGATGAATTGAVDASGAHAHC